MAIEPLMPLPAGWPAMSLEQARAALTAPGAKFEMEEAEIDGRRTRVWKNAPPTLPWLLSAARAFGDRTFTIYEDERVSYDANHRATAALAEHLAGLGIGRGDIGRYCCHPGGVKVIDAIETALALPTGELDLEREVLRDYGNMSSPTVLFVLERLVERGLPERAMMTAFGPGFTCAGLLLERP